MKRLSIFIFILLLAFSCSREVQEDQLVEWTFEAPATKASLSAGGAFSWASGDRIALWNQTGSQFVTFTSSTGSGRFSATAPADAFFTGVAWYPASAANAAGNVTLADSYTGDPTIQMMYAVIDRGSNILHFKHPVAFLTITILDADPSMDRITVSSPATSLSGTFPLTDASGEKVLPITEGSGSVTVNFSISSTQDVHFTIPIPVGQYSVTFAAGNASNPQMLKRKTDEVDFRRASLYRLAPATPGDILDSFTAIVTDGFSVESDDENWN